METARMDVKISLGVKLKKPYSFFIGVWRGFIKFWRRKLNPRHKQIGHLAAKFEISIASS